MKKLHLLCIFAMIIAFMSVSSTVKGQIRLKSNPKTITLADTATVNFLLNGVEKKLHEGDSLVQADNALTYSEIYLKAITKNVLAEKGNGTQEWMYGQIKKLVRIAAFDIRYKDLFVEYCEKIEK